MSIEKEPYSILYAEDEAPIRENYTKYLKKYFAKVYEAEDGESAYKVYKDKKPELMIVDINMPKMNGIELVKLIRKNDHSTKIILLTAHSDVEYLLDAAELMLTKYLIKPITRKDLKDTLYLAVQDMKNFSVSSNRLIPLREGYSFNLTTKELTDSIKVVELTNQEKNMLALLLENTSIVLSYEDIVYRLWDAYDDAKVSSIKTLVKKLRQKLPVNTIVNVFGVGYKVSI